MKEPGPGIRSGLSCMRAHYRSRLLFLAIILGSGILASREAAAQQIPLREAIVRFQGAWRVDISYDASLLDGRWTSWTRPEESNAEADLARLLEGTGLKPHRLAGGSLSVVLTPQAGIIVGRVLQASADTPLSRAHVQVETPEKLHIRLTDAGGRFRIPGLLPGTYKVVASHVGFAPDSALVTLAAGATSELTIRLSLVSKELPPVLIEAAVTDLSIPEILSNVRGREEVSLVAGLGTPDVIRSLDRAPGIQVGDLSGNVHIQGGDAGEHRFLLDGNSIFFPLHVLGLVGSINPFAVDRVEVSKAGFGAPEGSYLSGVIHASHALRDSAGYFGDFQIDPLSLNARLGADIGARVNFMGAVRRSLWNSVPWLRSSAIDSLLLSWNAPDKFLQRASFFTVQSLQPQLYDLFIQRLDGVPPPDLPDISFSDIHLAARVGLGGGIALSPSYFRSSSGILGRRLIASLLEDDESVAQPDQYEWKNESAQVTYSHVMGTSTLATVQARTSHYRLAHTFAGLSRQDAQTVIYDRLFFNLEPVDNGNEIREYGLGVGLDVQHAYGTFEMGAELVGTRHRFTLPSIFPQTINVDGASVRFAAYAEDTNSIAPGVTLTLGSRLTYSREQARWYAEPRSALAVDIEDLFAIQLAAGQYYQFVNQFEVTTLSPSAIVPYKRFWLPVDGSMKPPVSRHLAANLALTPGSHWTLRLEGYYKWQPRLYRVDYPTLYSPDDGEIVFRIPEPIETQDGFIELSHGRAYGVSAALEYARSWLGVGLQGEASIAEREYEFRGGERRMEPVPWSEPYRARVYFDLSPVPPLEFSAHLHGAWGRVWGFRQAYYDLLGMDVNQPLEFGEFDFRQPSTLQAHKLPPVRQLDLGISYERPVGSLLLRGRLDVLNAAGRYNIAHFDLREISVPATEPEIGPEAALTKGSRRLLGRTVVFSLRLHF